MRPSATRDLHAELVAAQRVDLVGLVVVRRQLAEVARVLVVLEDEVAVEVVHQPREDLLRLADRVDERVDVGGDVVGAEARARGRDDAEAAHQRLRAVVARAHADVRAAEQLADVVGVDAGRGRRRRRRRDRRRSAARRR